MPGVSTRPSASRPRPIGWCWRLSRRADPHPPSNHGRLRRPVALFAELDEFHRRARPDVFRRFDGPARTREQIELWLAGSGSTVLVAEIDREVVGLAVLLTRPPPTFAGAIPHKVVELDNLVVRSGLRSQGIGRHLIDAIVDWSRGQGASHLGVAVHAFNRDALRFYERAGFAPSIDRLVLAM